MTPSLELHPQIDPSDAKVLDDIKTYGWHVVKVFATENEQRPDWGFSIGLIHSFGHPEIIVLGLSLDNCLGVINEIGRQVKAGSRYEAGGEYADTLAGADQCAFRTNNGNEERPQLGWICFVVL